MMLEKNEIMYKVKMALLAMQRYSWEQGVAAQAFLELGENELVIQFAKEAVLRQIADGRLAVVGNASAVTDPAANGEAVLFASKVLGDSKMKAASDKMLQWLLYNAPRSKEGILYHIHDRPQVWVDSFYMAPPFLSVAGHHEEAVKQIKGYRSILFDPAKKLFSHIWDDSIDGFARKDFWGVGNGWALAGISRVIRTLPETMTLEKNILIGYVTEGIDGCISYLREDGLFHDIIDNPLSFVETNTSQMVAYTIFRGLQYGWLDKSYLKYAEKMRKAALDKVDEFGFVQGVSASPYFDRPGTASEGQAFFLLMEAAANTYYINN